MHAHEPSKELPNWTIYCSDRSNNYASGSRHAYEVNDFVALPIWKYHEVAKKIRNFNLPDDNSRGNEEEEKKMPKSPKTTSLEMVDKKLK